MNASPPGVRKPTLRRYVPQWLTSPLSSAICKTRQMPVPAPHRLREEQLTYPLRTGPSTQKTMTEANCQHHHWHRHHLCCPQHLQGASSFVCMHGPSVPCSGRLLSHSLTFCKSLFPYTLFLQSIISNCSFPNECG